LFNVQADRPESDNKYSTNGCSQVITGVKFNFVAAMHGAHHILHII